MVRVHAGIYQLGSALSVATLAPSGVRFWEQRLRRVQRLGHLGWPIVSSRALVLT